MQIIPNLVWTINSELQLTALFFQFSSSFMERNLKICENACTYSACKRVLAIRTFNSLAEQRAVITFLNPNRSVSFLFVCVCYFVFCIKLRKTSQKLHSFCFWKVCWFRNKQKRGTPPEKYSYCKWLFS